MKKRSLVAAAPIGFIFLLVLGIRAEAAEIKVLSAFGMQSVLEDLGPKFERATGHTLALTFATGGAMGSVKDAEAANALVNSLRTPEAGDQGEGHGACHSVMVSTGPDRVLPRTRASARSCTPRSAADHQESTWVF